MKSEVGKILKEYRPSKHQTLADQVMQKLCSPLGINNLRDAHEYLEDIKSLSKFRHREIVETGKAGNIRKGDLVKSIVSSDYLPYILETGVLSKEYLGVGEASDYTPLDTDVSIILDEPHDLRSALSETSAAAFSNMEESRNRNYYGAKESIFLVFRNDTRFERIEKDDIFFNKDKYEICGVGGGKVLKDMYANEYEEYEEYWYMDDYGIRTGIPSSEIDYIATDEKGAEKVVDAVKQSGLYIPVTDLDGRSIYNPFKH